MFYNQTVVFNDDKSYFSNVLYVAKNINLNVVEFATACFTAALLSQDPSAYPAICEIQPETIKHKYRQQNASKWI